MVRLLWPWTHERRVHDITIALQNRFEKHKLQSISIRQMVFLCSMAKFPDRGTRSHNFRKLRGCRRSNLSLFFARTWWHFPDWNDCNPGQHQDIDINQYSYHLQFCILFLHCCCFLRHILATKRHSNRPSAARHNRIVLAITWIQNSILVTAPVRRWIRTNRQWTPWNRQNNYCQSGVARPWRIECTWRNQNGREEIETNQSDRIQTYRFWFRWRGWKRFFIDGTC